MGDQVDDRCNCRNEVGAFWCHRGLVFMKSGSVKGLEG